MTRALLATFVALAASSSVGAAEEIRKPGMAEEVRHSGTVVAHDPRAGKLTLEEMVAWTGPGTGVVERTVTVTPDTSVQLVVRDEQDWSRASTPGFRETPFHLSRLEPGDFVTVTTRAAQPVAVSIEVWRPNATP